MVHRARTHSGSLRRTIPIEAVLPRHLTCLAWLRAAGLGPSNAANAGVSDVGYHAGAKVLLGAERSRPLRALWRESRAHLVRTYNPVCAVVGGGLSAEAFARAGDREGLWRLPEMVREAVRAGDPKISRRGPRERQLGQSSPEGNEMHGPNHAEPWRVAWWGWGGEGSQGRWPARRAQQTRYVTRCFLM